MKTRRIGLFLLSALFFGWAAQGVAQTASTPAPQSAPAILRAFVERVEISKKDVPKIIEAATAAAERNLAQPLALINVPYGPQPGFAEEMVNRSGGLANALPSEERMKQATPGDTVLFSVRSWESDGAQTLKLLNEYRQQKWMIVLFASKAGAPTGVQADYWIDNGARTGGPDEAPLNAIVNAMNGHVWCAEFASALTRKGKHPGVLLSILEKDSEAHNALFKDRRQLFPCSTPIPAGELAGKYFQAVAQVVSEVGGTQPQGQIRAAAEIISTHVAAGGKVGLASCDHILMSEITLNGKAPWTPFNVVWRTASGAFEKNVGPKDLLVWFGYVGLSTPLEDYGKGMRKSGAKLISCCAPDTEHPDNNAPDALARIDQSWTRPDAAVKIPFPPGCTAAVSGIEQGLLFRMLDDAVAARLSAATQPAK